MHPILTQLDALQAAIGACPALPVEQKASARRQLTEVERDLADALRPREREDRGEYWPVRVARAS